MRLSGFETLSCVVQVGLEFRILLSQLVSTGNVDVYHTSVGLIIIVLFSYTLERRMYFERINYFKYSLLEFIIKK